MWFQVHHCINYWDVLVTTNECNFLKSYNSNKIIPGFLHTSNLFFPEVWTKLFLIFIFIHSHTDHERVNDTQLNKLPKSYRNGIFILIIICCQHKHNKNIAEIYVGETPVKDVNNK